MSKRVEEVIKGMMAELKMIARIARENEDWRVALAADELWEAMNSSHDLARDHLVRALETLEQKEP